MEVRENPRNLGTMDDVRLSGEPLLTLVGALAELEGTVDQRHVQTLPVGLENLQELLACHSLESYGRPVVV